MTSRKSFVVIRLVSLVWTIAVIGVGSVAGGYIFVHTGSLLLVIAGISLVLVIGLGPLQAYHRRIGLPGKPESQTPMKWRKLSFAKLVIIQTVIAILFGYLLISLFPKVPLLSACIVSIVFAVLSTLLVKLIIAWMGDQFETLGFDLLRISPNDTDGDKDGIE